MNEIFHAGVDKMSTIAHMQNYKTKISEVIHRLLKASDLKPAQVGNDMQNKDIMRQSTFYRISSGETTNPGLERIEEIAAYFKISVSQLLGEVPLNDQNPLEAFANLNWGLFLKVATALDSEILAREEIISDDDKGIIVKEIYFKLIDNKSADLSNIIQLLVSTHLDLL